jgi:hypothetical protein
MLGSIANLTNLFKNMISNQLKLYFTIVLAGSLCFKAKAQSAGNIPQSVFPVLLIAPDARSGGMGNVGAATSPDANSANYNPAKLAFVNYPSGISTSYVPWLSNMVSDISLSYLSAYHKVNDQYTIAGSFRYFSLGNVDLADNNGASTGNYRPNEFAMDATIARKFGEGFSLATTLRYIHESSGTGSSFTDTQPANAIAADVSAYIKNPATIFQKEALLSYGINISNIGTKVSYSKNGPEYFLPVNLKLGAASAFTLDDENKLTIALDLNKLLVPTGYKQTDAAGNVYYDNSTLSVPSGIFNSFSDAPGGFAGELKQITYSVGAEYEYNHLLFLRAGYFYENPDNGNSQYFTAGTGFMYKQMEFDFSYLFGSEQDSPLANTLRFSLSYNFQ